jgi:aldose 1-epimerase
MELQAGLCVSKNVFGQMPDGTTVYVFTLKNRHNMTVKVINYGGIIAECWVPDRNGKLTNVVLGFDKLEPYLAKHPRLGATIGRYANRISNAQFELDGKIYKLKATKDGNCIHGGEVGFDKRVWTVSDFGQDEYKTWVKLSYLSKDMEEGFPGNLDVSIIFSLDDANSLMIKYEAQTDKPTALNLTNHSYFNLKGAGNGNVLEHTASFNVTNYTELDSNLITTGKIVPTKGTPYDFPKQIPIGERIGQTNGGYDINYIIDMRPGDIEGIGSVIEPVSGRVLTVYTDQPAFQFYTGNSLDGAIVGNGGSYEKYGGFCIETQQYPDSVNKPNFPSTILRPGQIYSTLTQYSFTQLPADS